MKGTWTRHRRRTPRGRWAPGALAAVLLSGATGCAEYRWTSDYRAAEARATAENRYLFIFYKSWLSSDSNRMHGDVLSDPAVAAHLQDTVNVLLEKDSSPEFRQYMLKYGVTTPPAFVVVAPDGTYQVRTGFVPRDRFIEFIESARTPRPSRPAPRPMRPSRPLVP